MADKKDEIWSDLHFGIQKDARGAVKKVKNVDAVITSINNILGTRKMERVMRPTFASGLTGLLFDPINKTTLDRIANGIKETIETWDDRVSITQVAVDSDPDNNKMSATIAFRIRGFAGDYSTLVPLK